MSFDFISIVGPNTEFTGADGRTYLLSPLGFGEIAEYLLWYKYKEYTDFKTVMVETPLSPALKLTEEERIFRECQAKNPAPEDIEVAKSYLTPAGMEMQLYLSLRTSYPGFKREDLTKIINHSNLAHAFKKLEDITGIFPAMEPGTAGSEADPVGEI